MRRVILVALLALGGFNAVPTQAHAADDGGALVAIEVISTRPVMQATTATGTPCWVWTQRVKGRALLGTMWSHSVTMHWCTGSRVYHQSTSERPDVTAIGAALGWTFDGRHQPTVRGYYHWQRPYGGYRYLAYGIFGRCLARIGCTQQVFTKVGMAVHFDNTQVGAHDAW